MITLGTPFQYAVALGSKAGWKMIRKGMKHP